jgi:hypothetical protein
LRIQKLTKKEPEITLKFSSKLRRAELRAEIESGCDISDLPKDVTIFVPTSSKKQWGDLFHAKIPHMGDRKTIPFPSCEDIDNIRMSKAPNGEVYLAVRTNRKGKKAPLIHGQNINSEKEITIRARDEESALRVGLKLAADCGVPFKQ